MTPQNRINLSELAQTDWREAKKLLLKNVEDSVARLQRHRNAIDRAIAALREIAPRTKKRAYRGALHITPGERRRIAAAKALR